MSRRDRGIASVCGTPKLIGVALSLVGLASVGLGGYAAARLWLRQPHGPPAALGAVILAWAWISLGTLVLGLLGSLTRLALIGWCGLAAVPAVIFLIIGRIPEPVEVSRPRERWGLDGGLALGLTLWAMIVAGVPSLIFPVKVMSDGPIYHLYFAARWWKAGRIFLIPTPFSESAAPYFPALGDLWHTFLFVMCGGDSLARIGQVPFLLVSAFTVHVIARRLGAGLNASTIAACVFTTVSPLMIFSLQPVVDTLFVAGYLIGVYFGLRFFLRDDGAASLAIAALALGAAWGCKAPGVVFIPPILLAMAVGVLIRNDKWSARLRNLAIVAFVPFVLEGYWLAQNTWLTGNPLYPLHLQVLGKTVLHGWYGPEAMPSSPYYIPLSNWRAFIDLLVVIFDPRVILIVVAGLVGSWRIGKPRAVEDRAVWVCALLAVINIALYWLVIPYRTQLRFLFHAAGLAAIPMAILLDRWRGLRWLTVVALGLHLLTAQGWPFGPDDAHLPWDLTKVIPNALTSMIPFPTYLTSLSARPETGIPLLTAAKLGIGLACLLLGVSLRWTWSGGWRRRLLPIGGMVVLSVGQVLLTAPARSSIVYRFPNFPNYLRGWIDLDARVPRSGARIAYAGTNLPYYLMGPDFRNDVRYINVDEHKDWLLHDYHRAASSLGLPSTWTDTRPGWDRARPDYFAWLANLRSERIQLLVVAQANPDEGRHNIADDDGFPIERVWADAHPDAFTRLYADPLFLIYGIKIPPKVAEARRIGP